MMQRAAFHSSNLDQRAYIAQDRPTQVLTVHNLGTYDSAALGEVVKAALRAAWAGNTATVAILLDEFP